MTEQERQVTFTAVDAALKIARSRIGEKPHGEGKLLEYIVANDIANQEIAKLLGEAVITLYVEANDLTADDAAIPLRPSKRKLKRGDYDL